MKGTKNRWRRTPKPPKPEREGVDARGLGGTPERPYAV